MSRKPRKIRGEHKRFEEANGHSGTGSTPLTRNTRTAKRSRQEAGLSWGRNGIGKTANVREADYGAIRVKLDSSKGSDPRVVWAQLEEDLPNDLDREFDTACSRDLRHFKSCDECSRGLQCEDGANLSVIRQTILDVIALRNRGYALLHEPRIQVPGSAYGNTR